MLAVMKVLFAGSVWLFFIAGAMGDARQPARDVSRSFEQVNCDQTELEIESRELSNGKRVRVTDLRCYELEEGGCALTLSYLTDADTFSDGELLLEVEEIWNGFRDGAEASGVQRVTLWADNQRIAWRRDSI